MNLLYMGYFCNEDLFNQLVEAGSRSSHARQQLETKLLEGFIGNMQTEQLEVVSYLPYIEHVAKAAGNGEIYKGVKIRYLWCNKRKITSLVGAFFRNVSYIKEWAKCNDKKVVLTYSTNPIHVIPLILLRKRYKFEIVTLCSEVSIFRRKDNCSLVSSISRRISSALDNSFDGYVLLSKYMNEVINKKERPYVVMEGISKEQPQLKDIQKKPAVLYAGGLSEDNGIRILMDGFVQAGIEGLELWICGDGPLAELVKEYSGVHQNIRFWGIVSNQLVQRMEQEAELLIAPRFSKNEFTKYSFPSKTIEYMSSGTPTVLTRLKGIPEEYFAYVYVLENETSEGVSILLREIFSEDTEGRMKRGRDAREFVLKNKNYLVQSEKIIDFLKRYDK